MNRELLARAARATRADRVVLDMDSSESPVHGAQEGSAYNGHFATVCYHPLFLFNDQGDCLAASLRPGNVPSADDWDDLLVPEIDRQQAAGRRVAFRADAAFARPAIYEGLEHRDVAYAIRMPANKNLELAVEEILFRPPGRPSGKPLVRYKSFRYQAKSWTTPRRIVAKVEHHRGELFPRVGFIVTNMALPSRCRCRQTDAARAAQPAWRRRDTRRERCLRNALNAGMSVGGTAARAELTASEAGRCCDEQEFRALGGLRVYKGAIWGRQIGNLGYRDFTLRLDYRLDTPTDWDGDDVLILWEHGLLALRPGP